jgi:hypothetical protein
MMGAIGESGRGTPRRPTRSAPPDGEPDWWVPAHLGGSAPTPEEAQAIARRGGGGASGTPCSTAGGLGPGRVSLPVAREFVRREARAALVRGRGSGRAGGGALSTPPAWEEVADPGPRVPTEPLRGDVTADCVIGLGASGAAAARYAAERGADVVGPRRGRCRRRCRGAQRRVPARRGLAVPPRRRRHVGPPPAARAVRRDPRRARSRWPTRRRPGVVLGAPARCGSRTSDERGPTSPRIWRRCDADGCRASPTRGRRARGCSCPPTPPSTRSDGRAARPSGPRPRAPGCTRRPRSPSWAGRVVTAGGTVTAATDRRGRRRRSRAPLPSSRAGCAALGCRCSAPPRPTGAPLPSRLPPLGLRLRPAAADRRGPPRRVPRPLRRPRVGRSPHGPAPRSRRASTAPWRELGVDAPVTHRWAAHAAFTPTAGRSATRCAPACS